MNISDVLLTVDFDRTLTAPDSTIPQRNIEAIQHFMRSGGSFTVNTGRSVPMFRAIGDCAVPTNAPLLLYNGSAAYDPVADQLSQVHPIELDLWKTMQELMELFPDLTVEVQGVDAHYNFVENPSWNAFYDYNRCAHRTVPIGTDIGPFLKFSIYGKFHDSTVSGLFGATPEEKKEIDEAEQLLRRLYGDKVEVSRSAMRIVDAQAKGTSKIRSARELQQKLGKKILVCVGDAPNDYSMLKGADYSFCPADGLVADQFETVCSCGEGAVADVIYQKIPEILMK